MLFKLNKLALYQDKKCYRFDDFDLPDVVVGL